MATALQQFTAVGRRKNAVARVYLRPGGSGKIVVNKKAYDTYFPTAWRQKSVTSPFEITETTGSFDVVVNAKGGGITGQAEAIRLGISRALVDFNEELRSPLRQAGFLTRDPRMVERKKYGQPKARKRFQFSKR
ncbi:MAG: 30S ribosomal protein S9 [Bacteroidetes bacterium CG12_big_fil_rev_8_21_14_0_65_60_17]|nr:MAG: 30S ribosomal protein S9 [Bacteroidetes bacterium CG12_big_fil_rev_8_21_14_0_65_60_17]